MITDVSKQRWTARFSRRYRRERSTIISYKNSEATLPERSRKRRCAAYSCKTLSAGERHKKPFHCNRNVNGAGKFSSRLISTMHYKYDAELDIRFYLKINDSFQRNTWAFGGTKFDFRLLFVLALLRERAVLALWSRTGASLEATV